MINIITLKITYDTILKCKKQKTTAQARNIKDRKRYISRRLLDKLSE